MATKKTSVPDNAVPGNVVPDDVAPENVALGNTASPNAAQHFPVVVIGAGFAGIALGVELRAKGITDFVILERSSGLGGTWRANTYPGCACDVPSQLYSYSFAPNPDWSRTYGTQPEILAYLEKVAADFEIVPHMRFDVEVADARFDEDAEQWRIATGKGDYTADVLISAVGPFSEANIPNLPGKEKFAGTQFHSLHWDHDHDLTGERVAVIGTGASAVQFIPEIQPKVGKLTVFQRSAPWIVSRLDRRTTGVERALLRILPVLGKAVRGAFYTGIESFGLVGFVDKRFRHPYEALAKLQLLRQVRDPKLRKILTPDYVIGCKRAIFSDAYFPALTQPNVEVVTAGIEQIKEHSVVTADGVEHPVDTLIWGTGFGMPAKVFERIHAVDGRSAADIYREAPSSYLGTSMAGFPNFFTTLGPFGVVGNQSAVFMIESQARYIVDALTTMRDKGIARVVVRPEVQEAFLADVNARSTDTAWLTGGCNSYYTTADGANSGLYPSWSFEYARRTRRFDAESYEMRTR
ncbi:NAD(P)/FAD-dependent oxidoreductase [Nocardia higoensis]|uniref:NAD(P)/FAD-dependent oxidoreductase n=1 Tax=Nocardia higoensis TaxID=228599 RepID=A0ABS0D6W6_9NOCA|nr:NAD(P)/FAD-dependent oxidoreductase [Nocardia higoensis]MBF6354218.1 NAD(P)/FAD-dependent oxidoreductase [Nocardia higoensis]